MGKPLPVFGMGFIKSQAIFHNGQDLGPGLNSGNFHGKPGMTAQPSPQHHAKAFFLLFKGAGWADLDAFAAQKTKILVNDGDLLLLIQANSPIRANINTGAAKGAIFFPLNRPDSTYNTDVHNLGAGTGIGAVGQGNPEFMVEF